MPSKEATRRWLKEHPYPRPGSNAAYQRQYAKQRRAAFRAFLWGYKSLSPCVDCGEDDPEVLDFDHVSGKRILVSRMGGYSTKEILAEIAKCQVRCANCHRRVTLARLQEMGQFGWRPRVNRDKRPLE